MNVAAIDLGSNSTRLLILGPQGNDLARAVTVTKLAAGVDADRRLRADAMERTLESLRAYRRELDGHGVSLDHLSITTTSASRDAENRDEFFSLVADVIGKPPTLLSGTDEAVLSFRGATSWLTPRTNEWGEPALDVVVDIGGGSTELAVGRPGESPLGVWSIDAGGVRLTEQWLHGDPPTAEELSNAVMVMHSHLDDAEREVPELKNATRLIGVAAITTLAAVEIGLLTYDRDRIHRFGLTHAAAEDVFRTLATENRRDRAHNPGLHPDRVETIVGAALILVTVMRHWKHDVCLVSETDSLDAAARSLLV
jgi:exopolyphosphatase / guanosine-5'-triphosphate,3'-diphosphate pyrophosphatase